MIITIILINNSSSSSSSSSSNGGMTSTAVEGGEMMGLRAEREQTRCVNTPVI